jgi:hypothetical protein
MNIDAAIVDELGELVDLGKRRELHLVDHENLDASSEEFVDVRVECDTGLDGFGRRFDTNPTRHHSVVASIAERPERNVTSAFAKLPAELESESRLA